MRKPTFALFSLALLAAVGAQAQSTYRWVDKDGKVHYGDRPPPARETREMGERKYALPEADPRLSLEMRQATAAFPVTLYVQTTCAAACQMARDYLKGRGIPYKEVAVTNNEEAAALRDRLGGGELMIPLLTVGERSARGYLESTWASLLDAAGYPKKP